MTIPTSPAGPTAPVSPAPVSPAPVSPAPVSGGPAGASQYTKYTKWAAIATAVIALCYLCCGCGLTLAFDYFGLAVAATIGLACLAAAGIATWTGFTALNEGDDEARKWQFVAWGAFAFSVVSLIVFIIAATAKVAGLGV